MNKVAMGTKASARPSLERWTWIWSDVLHYDKTVAPYMTPEELNRHSEKTIATNADGSITHFFVWCVREGQVYALSIKGTKRRIKDGKIDAWVHPVDTYLPPLNHEPSEDSEYSRVMDAYTDLNDRLDHAAALQLYHELIHTLILHERDRDWGSNPRPHLDEYNAWAAHAWSKKFEKERDTLIDLLGGGATGAKNFEEVINEKFTAQKAFRTFRSYTFNQEIATKFSRRFGLNSVFAIYNLFVKLDEAHGEIPPIYKKWPRNKYSPRPTGPTLPWGPTEGPVLEHDIPGAPSGEPWRFIPPGGPAINRLYPTQPFRPPPAFPTRMARLAPPPLIRRPPVIPPFRPRISPPPPIRTMPRPVSPFPRPSFPPPITRRPDPFANIMRGRIGALAPPPAFPKAPDHLRRSGVPWNPVGRFGISNGFGGTGGIGGRPGSPPPYRSPFTQPWRPSGPPTGGFKYPPG